MWLKSSKNYPQDTSLIKERVESGKGIVGCEMHDLNGWGNTIHQSKTRKKGLAATLLDSIFGRKKTKNSEH